MRRVKEVLRLRFELGFGQRQIARSCRMGLSTVHEYLERAEARVGPNALSKRHRLPPRGQPMGSGVMRSCLRRP